MIILSLSEAISLFEHALNRKFDSKDNILYLKIDLNTTYKINHVSMENFQKIMSGAITK